MTGWEAVWNSEVFSLVVLPILIFMARILDVSLGTMRITFVSRGMRGLAVAVSFFEILIWIMAVGQIMQNLTNVMNYIAYAGGFATGTYVGMRLTDRMAVGVVNVRIITQRDATRLREHLKKEAFGYTSFAAESVSGKVRLLMVIINRKELKRLLDVVRRFNPRAFVAVEDVSSVSGDEVFNLIGRPGRHIPWFHFRRKGK